MNPSSRLSSRRDFLKTSCQGTLAVAAIRSGPILTSSQSVGAQPPFQTQGKFIDVHVHLGQPWNERGELTAPMLIRWMDLNQISQAWVLPLISPEAWYYPITTEWVLKETKPFRDRLIPFCVVDPRTNVFGGKKHFVDILSRYKDAGAKGFGEHKWGGPIDDPRNIELVQACAETELPVLFHLDNIRNTDTPGLPGLENLLKAVPDAKLIGHGPGWWASVSKAVTQADLGGYPKGPVEPGGALDRLMAEYPNLYADLSAGSGHNAMRRDLKFAREFMIRNSSQIMFGTDYLAKKQVIHQFDLFADLDLPADIEQNILRDNAAKLINIQKS